MLSKLAQQRRLPLSELVNLSSFQADVAKKFLGFIPGQHQRRGILTPTDDSFHPAVIDAFINENHLGFNEAGVRDPRTFELISSIIDPVRTLMRETENENGRFFYTIFPFGEFGPTGWAPELKRVLHSKRFQIDFMYGGVDGCAVRLVIAVRHGTNPKVSPHGLGVLIQNLFGKTEGKSFAPVLTLNAETLMMAISHVSHYRNSTNCKKNVFSPYDPSVGDVGNELAGLLVEWMRFTSCRLILDGLQRDLENPELREYVRKWNEDCCRHNGIPFQFDAEDPAFCKWNSRDKEAHTVSALFQARLMKSSDWEDGTAYDRLLEALKQLGHSSYPGMTFHWRLFAFESKYPTALVHVLFQFSEKVQMYGVGHLNERLQNMAHRVRFCSVMSLMPVDFRSDNLLALAVLASFDGKSSPKRDQLWRVFCKGVAKPEPEIQATASLPEPTPRKPVMPMISPLPYQAVVVRVQTPARGRSRTPTPRSRTVSPQARFPSHSETIDYRAPAAAGRLLESIGDLQRAPAMEDYAPGSQVFQDLFTGHRVLLYIPEWIFDVMDFDADIPFETKKDLASTIFGSSVIRCLKILAQAMQVCGKMLYRASREIVLILRDALDPLDRLSQHLNQGLQACKGVLPVLDAFRHMKGDPIAKIGTMPESAGGDPILPMRPLTFVMASLPNHNRVKTIYCHMLAAHNRLEEMCPENDVYICWDRISHKAWELHHELLHAQRECHDLIKYCSGKL